MQTGASVDYIDGMIAFLRMTSKIIDIFADHRPIADLGDHCLAMNNEVMEYLNKKNGNQMLHNANSFLKRKEVNDFFLTSYVRTLRL